MTEITALPNLDTPAQVTDSLLVYNSSNPAGNRVAEINMSGVQTEVLRGDGTFGVLPSSHPGSRYLPEFGAVGQGGDDSAIFQTAIDTVAASGEMLIVPTGEYIVTTTLVITSAAVATRGFFISGNGPYYNCKINYSGTGPAFSFTGSGTESGNPLAHIHLENLCVTGGGNVVSDGGFYFDRCYIVTIKNCASTNWAAVGAHALEARNVFNFEWTGGQLANSYGTTTSGDSVVVVGAKDSGASDEWNNSNIAFKNLLIQNGGEHGVVVEHDGNILDNLSFDNVSFGKNAKHAIHIDNSNVANVSIKNGHFESSGYNGTGIDAIGTHIYAHNVKGLYAVSNSMQDTMTYIDLDSVVGGVISANKIFETGFYTLTGNTAIKIRTSGDTASVQIDVNAIRNDQIDNFFDFDTTSRINQAGGGVIYHSETFWTSDVLTGPENFKGAIINRTGSSNAPYDQMFSPDGANWFRVMISNKYRGECSTIPTGSGGQGYFYLNSAGTVQSDDIGNYILFGWYYTAGAWHEMRAAVNDRTVP